MDKIYNRLKFMGVTYNGYTFNYEYVNMSSDRNDLPPYATTAMYSANMALLLGYNENTETWEVVREKNRYGRDWIDDCSNFKELSDKLRTHEPSTMAKEFITDQFKREVDARVTEIVGNYFG